MLLFAGSLTATAQQSDATEILPDAPAVVDNGQSAAQSQTSTPQATPAQATSGQSQAPPKRLFYIIPNFRSVNTTTVLPPQKVKDKFVSASEDTFDYSSLVLALMLVSYNYGLDKTPEFHRGGAAFGRYAWHSAADQSIENYMVEFVVPVMTREDTRFYQMGRGGFRKRAIYSLTRVAVTRMDNGHEGVNLGELLGAAGATEISSRYYPAQERSAGNFFGSYGTDLAIDAAAYFIREFEPEISRKLFHSHAGGAAD
jgi:hypothetical protein